MGEDGPVGALRCSRELADPEKDNPKGGWGPGDSSGELGGGVSQQAVCSHGHEQGPILICLEKLYPVVPEVRVPSDY